MIPHGFLLLVSYLSLFLYGINAAVTVKLPMTLWTGPDPSDFDGTRSPVWTAVPDSGR